MVRIKLVGCNFHPASKKCIENEVVRVIRDPENKFDPEAIKVINSLGELIGYVGTAKTVSRGNRKNGCIDNHFFLFKYINYDRIIRRCLL